MIVLFVTIYWNLLFGCNGESIDLNMDVNRQDWLDPNDPFAPPSFCTEDTLNQLAICEGQLQKYLKAVSQAAIQRISDEGNTKNYYVHDSTLKHIIRNFLHRMNIDLDKAKRVERTVEVYLNADSLAILRKYLNSKDETVTVREQVREVLEGMIIPASFLARVNNVQQHYEDISFVKRSFNLIVSFLPLLNAVLLVPALIIICRNHFSMRSFILLFLFISFVISVFNTYRKKYQANIAARMSRAEKSLTEKCRADSFLSTALKMVTGLFTFKGENECEQHYKDLYVDPIYEISPLDVICDVLSNFIFTSLGVFGRHLNIFFNEFFRDSPLHFIIVKIITFFFLIFALIFWLGGYRIRTFMTTIEPTGITHTTSRMLQPPDYQLYEEQPKIKPPKSRAVLSVGLQPARSIAASHIKRRSLSASRLRTVNH